jgi:lipoprotein-releasing system permease protein
VVAAFNIVSSLVMVVTDKKSDIAILRTLGASPSMITKIFMVQGTVIGVIGTVAGTVLGVIWHLRLAILFLGLIMFSDLICLMPILYITYLLI